MRISPQERPIGTTPPCIGIVADAFFEDFYAGIAAYSRSSDWDLEQCMIRSPGLLPPKNEEWEGIIAIALGNRSIGWLAETKAPVVYALDPNSVPPNSPLVIADLEAVGRCGAQHFLELGNLGFAFYRAHGSPDVLSIQSGFNEEIERHGYLVSNLNFATPGHAEWPQNARTTRAGRVAWLVGELKNAKSPLAVMAEDDRYAIDLLYVARILGLRVPEDLAILGTEDDRLILSPVSIGISSVDINLYGIGWRAAELLHRLMNGAKAGSKDAPLLTRVPPRGVVVRESTATFVCTNPSVTAAAMFVRRNFREAISVKDVAGAAHISLRRLQEEYPAHVGRNIKDDIVQRRLAAAQQLLARTDLKLAAVASETGFGNIEHFCKVFRHECGMTPHEWRQRRARPAAGRRR